jgi:hypothetical protein
MARWFVVDAHNALFRLGDVPDDPEEQRRALLVRASEALRGRRGGAQTGDRVLLVFDATKGSAWAGKSGRDGAIGWSYAEGSADEEIVALVRSGGDRPEGRTVVVVTDDRELAGRASQLGARTLRVSDWFSSSPAAPSSPERESRPSGPPMTASDFGFTSDSIDLDDPRNG